MPVLSTRSVKVPESISSVIRLVELVFRTRRRWRAQRVASRSGGRSCFTPPNAMVPAQQSRAEQTGPAAGRDLRVGPARRLAGTVKATSVARAPMSAMWLYSRSSSSRTTRSDLGARGYGRCQPAARSRARTRARDPQRCHRKWIRPGTARVPPRQPLEALFDSLVHVEQPELQVQHRLTGHAESEMAGLDDACVHGPDGHLEHAFAGDRSKRVEIAWRRAAPACRYREILAQRPRPIRPVVVEGDPLGFGWSSGTRPKKSMTSRSNQFAAGYLAAIEGKRAQRDPRAPRAAETTRRFGRNQTMVHDEIGRWRRRSSLAKSDSSRPLRSAT